MSQKLQHVHDQLMEIAKEAKDLSHKQYTNKLHHIDENYKQGYIDDTDNSKPFDDPYEHQGQAQVSDELSKIHQTLTVMLSRIE
ncbi:hypothetical protein VTP01DRAFT_6111 [Rhizomucor pusillus]|uniref:uncharacterized protein n=1 Tax=Rhizomucor pusillus TaxID=4840 RepID=UPI0037445512